MAVFTNLRFTRSEKIAFLSKVDFLFNNDGGAFGCYAQRRHMSPRKNSPFISKASKVSPLDGSMGTSKKSAIPESLYHKPVIPKTLVKYNEYKKRVVVDSPGGMFTTYTPLAKRSSIFSLQGWKQRWQAFKDFFLTTYSIGLIKTSVKPFKLMEFGKEAESLFVDVNTCLTNEDKTGLLERTTLSAYYGFTKEFFDARRKFHWRFVSTVARPRIVHAAVSSLEVKKNLFAQVVVRVNIKQVLAVLDRNGRVLSGDAKNPRELLEYIVLERHLADKRGKWKICGKLFAKN